MNRHENESGIRVYYIVGNGRTVLSETATDISQKRIRVRRYNGRCILYLGPMEIDLPERIALNLRRDLYCRG